MDSADNPPHPHNAVVVRDMLLEGYHAAAIAKKLNISRQAVAKYIKKYVASGLIKEVSQNPKHYAKVIHDNPPHVPVATDNHQATIFPHHYGGRFAVSPSPKLNYDKNGKWYERKPTHTIQIGKHKAQIWIKSFADASPAVIRKKANDDLNSLANRLERDFQTNLTLLEIYTNIEWAILDQGTSDKIASSIGLDKQEERIVDNVIHKNGDASHTTIEFIPIKGNPTGPTKHADAHHFVYSGDLARTLEAMGDSLIGINQRLIQMEKKN